MYEPSVIAQLRAGESVSVEEAALLISTDAKPGLSSAACLRALDELAAPMKRATALGGSPEDLARLLALQLAEHEGFRGNSVEYEDPRNSYLHEVLRRRLGIPISLTIIWMAVGRRAGMQIDGIPFPGHFLARVGGPSGVLVDPFHGGRLVGENDLQRILQAQGLGDTSFSRSMLHPANTRAVLIRMLMNLKRIHEARGDFRSLLLVCDRLVDLTDAPEHRRDRGVAAYHLGSFQAASDDLFAYVDHCADAPDAWQVAAAAERARSRSTSNLQ